MEKKEPKKEQKKEQTATEWIKDWLKEFPRDTTLVVNARQRGETDEEIKSFLETL